MANSTEMKAYFCGHNDLAKSYRIVHIWTWGHMDTGIRLHCCGGKLPFHTRVSRTISIKRSPRRRCLAKNREKK